MKYRFIYDIINHYRYCLRATLRKRGRRVIDYITELPGNFITQIKSITILDIVDILTVSVVLYYLIKFVRERRAGKLALGIVFLILIQLLGQLIGLVALSFIMQNVFQAGLLALVIVFNPEIRSALEKMGGEPLKNLRSIGEQKDNSETQRMINDLCEALFDLSKDKTGALVVIERTTRLGDIIKTGELINANMSPFLLKNIFFNKAPLHDGAVIIRDNRIWAAGCFLRVSTNTDIIKDLGTRHRAAIGMSEDSDAVILIVSEETGVVSMAHEGKLRRSYDYTTLKRDLDELLLSQPDIKKRVKNVFTHKNGGDKA